MGRLDMAVELAIQLGVSRVGVVAIVTETGL